MNGIFRDTIAALATPVGLSGIAVIRLSGEQSLTIACHLARADVGMMQSHQIRFAKLYDDAGALLDEVLWVWMQEPRSFTGESVVELQCHGSMLIVRKILESCYRLGARAAQPGEFSLRAFKNRKIDLVQAQAIQALIHAKSERALQVAQSQLTGRLSELIREFQKGLTHQAAILEAWVDFPEEGLEFATFDEVESATHAIEEQIKKLLNTFHDGQLICDGIGLCLLGRPNVGKSSLMNTLLRKERSIVTEIAGTTRDVIEEQATLCGLNVRLMDTAGVREASERIEQEGIRRTWEKVKQADLILWILDASDGYTQEDIMLSERVPKDKTILVWNKCDLPHEDLPNLDIPYSICISAQTHQGIDDLQELISQVIWREGPLDKEEILLTSLRHAQALEKTVKFLQLVRGGLCKHISAEFVCSDMRQALHSLATIIGTDVTEDIITDIFSTFCLGK